MARQHATGDGSSYQLDHRIDRRTRLLRKGCRSQFVTLCLSSAVLAPKVWVGRSQMSCCSIAYFRRGKDADDQV